MAVLNVYIYTYPLKNNECNEENGKKIIFYLPEESFQIKFNGILCFFYFSFL